MQKFSKELLKDSSLEILTSTIKGIMVIVMLFEFECIYNLFVSKDKQIKTEFKDYLYFSNISLFLTVFSVLLGFLKEWFSSFSNIHNFLVPFVLTLEIMVSLIFWCLFLVDPKLVKAYKKTYNNKVLYYVSEMPKHLLPAVLMTLELLSLKSAPVYFGYKSFAFAFTLVYFVISESYILIFSDYLYPFLQEFNFLSRFSIFLVLGFAGSTIQAGVDVLRSF